MSRNQWGRVLYTFHTCVLSIHSRIFQLQTRKKHLIPGGCLYRKAKKCLVILAVQTVVFVVVVGTGVTTI